MGRIGLLVAAALIASGFGVHQVYAQSDNTSAQKAEKAEKKKAAAEKKNAAQNGAQTVPGPAPMSGYRPDSLSNY